METKVDTPPVAAIAQYWGAKCSYIGPNLDFEYEPMVGIVNEWRFIEMKNYRNFKIHLRPPSALTDDHLRVIAGMLGIGEGAIVRDDWCITFSSIRGDEVPLVHLHIGLDGEIGLEDEDGDLMLFNPAPVIAYAMQQGYYWPGSIDECFVKLLTE